MKKFVALTSPEPSLQSKLLSNNYAPPYFHVLVPALLLVLPLQSIVMYDKLPGRGVDSRMVSRFVYQVRPAPRWEEIICVDNRTMSLGSPTPHQILIGSSLLTSASQN